MPGPLSQPRGGKSAYERAGNAKAFRGEGGGKNRHTKHVEERLERRMKNYEAVSKDSEYKRPGSRNLSNN